MFAPTKFLNSTLSFQHNTLSVSALAGESILSIILKTAKRGVLHRAIK